MIEHWVGSGAPGSKISKIEPTDSVSDGKLRTQRRLLVRPGYAQLMQNRLLVFKPAIVSSAMKGCHLPIKRSHAVVSLYRMPILKPSRQAAGRI